MKADQELLGRIVLGGPLQVCGSGAVSVGGRSRLDVEIMTRMGLPSFSFCLISQRLRTDCSVSCQVFGHAPPERESFSELEILASSSSRHARTSLAFRTPWPLIVCVGS